MPTAAPDGTQSSAAKAAPTSPTSSRSPWEPAPSWCGHGATQTKLTFARLLRREMTPAEQVLWAALRAATEEGVTAHVVVMEPPGRAASPTDRTRQAAMARRCDIELHYMREVLGTRQGRT